MVTRFFTKWLFHGLALASLFFSWPYAILNTGMISWPSAVLNTGMISWPSVIPNMEIQLSTLSSACRPTSPPALPGASVITAAQKLLPDWIRWERKQIRFDLNQDGRYDLLTLQDGQVRVCDGEELLYETPYYWLIADAFVSDLDGDGSQEMLFLAWRMDSFGYATPFWMKRDPLALTEHLFVLHWKDGEVRQKWMSSDFGSTTSAMWLDKQGRVRMKEISGTETTWAWDYFGFALVEEKQAPSPDASGNTSSPDISGEPASPYGSLTFLAVGDNLMHESIYAPAYVPEKHLFDFSPVYENVSGKIASYDIAVVNQETILVHDPAHRSGYPEFATPESVGDALADAGFDIVLAATNHVNDMGPKAIADTLAFWKNHPDIHLLGLHESKEDAQQIDLYEKNGVRLALFNYTYGLNGHALPAGENWRVDLLTEEDRLLADLQKAKAWADLSLCFLHMGEEYGNGPSEEDWALWERLIDAGADVIICAHPHVVWPVSGFVTKKGNRGLIFESLGNFTANMSEWRTTLGGAASLTLRADGVVSYDLLPLICHFGNRKTTVYFLSDYTEDLAAAHSLSQRGTPATLHDLWKLWKEETN